MRSIGNLQPKIGRAPDAGGESQEDGPRIGHDPSAGLASVGGQIKQRLSATAREIEDEDLNIERVFEILRFLVVPGIFMGAIVLLQIPMPRLVLYGIAGAILGSIILRAREQPEIILAVSLLYLPFAKLYAVSIAPLVNGTNIFIALCLFFAWKSAKESGTPFLPAIKGRNLVLAWWILSCGSIATLVFTPGALSWVIGNELSQATAWMAQAGFYVAVIGLVRTPGQAKRMAIYSMIGTLLVVGLGAKEWVEKRGASSIEKARVGGTFEQPNDFGGFLAFTTLPIAALLLFNLTKVRYWVLAPYLLLTAKVLIATFSRGAYVALAAGGGLLTYFRGKRFLVLAAVLGIGTLAAFPSLIPQSIMARLNQTTDTGQQGQLDRSSEIRFILWEAAGNMIAESPILGKGFKAFPYLKAQYTREQVKEGDPHSMYFYVAAQMGLPAFFIFLSMKAMFMWMGWQIYRRSEQRFERILGASAASMVLCLALINVFGSRMVNLEFTAYFYAYLVIMQVLYTNLLRVEASRGAFDPEDQPEVGRKEQLVSVLGMSQDPENLRSKLGRQVTRRTLQTKVGLDASKAEFNTKRIGHDGSGLPTDHGVEHRDVKIGFRHDARGAADRGSLDPETPAKAGRKRSAEPRRGQRRHR